VSITNTNLLILFSKTTTVNSKNHTEHTNTQQELSMQF